MIGEVVETSASFEDRFRATVRRPPLPRRAAMLADVPTGESPAGGNCPVTTVVIPGVGEGDQPDGSPGVKASVGREIPGRIRQGRQATRQVVAKQTSVD